jgi:hypothetical protein
MKAPLALALMVGLAGAAGCGLMYDPSVGPIQLEPVEPTVDGGPVATGKCGDSNPAVEVSLGRDLQPLFNRAPGGRCDSTNCHGSGASSGLNMLSYASLRQGGQISGPMIIVAGKPCDSILVHKLSSAPPYGARMPYEGPPYWTADELQLLRDWIAEGAKNN